MSEEFNDKQMDDIEEEFEDIDEQDVDYAETTSEKNPAKTGKKPVAAKKKARKKSRIARWFREMRSELKKVIWPTPKQIVNNTLVSLVVMVASGVVIWAVDQVGSQIFRMLITLGS